MTEISDRYDKVSRGFTRRVASVPNDAWDKPAPCEGWDARDVVRHMVEWMPDFFGENALEIPTAPSVDDDPVAAWARLNGALRSALDDPTMATSELETRAGRFTFENAVAIFIIPDVLVHTWDLARATGLDETLDADEVHDLYQGMLPIDDLLRSSGQYGPRVTVPDDADEQTKLIAFTGRQP